MVVLFLCLDVERVANPHLWGLLISVKVRTFAP